MIPPTFSDLGKAAKDLFDKKFKFGCFHVECISKKESRSLTINATHDLKTKNLSGTFENKYSANYGIDILQKWSTNNVLTTEVSKTYESIKGLKNVGVLSYEPESGKKTFNLKDSYKREYLNFNGNVIFNSCKPDINANVVFGCTHPKPYLGGIDLTIDTNTHTFKNYTFALGYEKQDFGAVAFVKDLSQFNSYLYQKISKHSEVGINVSHNQKTKETKYGIVGQYHIPNSDNSFVKVKINQDTLVGLVYGCTINDGVQLTLSAEIDGKKLETGPHNIGIGLVYEP